MTTDSTRLWHACDKIRKTKNINVFSRIWFHKEIVINWKSIVAKGYQAPGLFGATAIKTTSTKSLNHPYTCEGVQLGHAQIWAIIR